MQPYYEPGSVAQPETPRPTPAPAASPPDGEKVEWASDGSKPVPHINLLEPKMTTEAPTPVAAATTVDATVPAVAGVATHRKRGLVFVLLVSGVVLVLAGGAGAYVLLAKKPAQVAKSTLPPARTPTPLPNASTTPSPTATPTPAATPVPTAVPLTVTAPTVAPTLAHPQAVIITSSSGLWMRSSATSVNRSNIISWMPKGATVSVDQAGDFWWHGTYKGVTGYFASKYTQ